MIRSPKLRLLGIALACLYWLTCSACFLCGNGEPICGQKANPGEATPGGANPSLNTPLNGTYYREQPGYTCTPSGSSTPIPSYRNALSYGGGESAVLLGDACQATSISISTNALTLSIDRSLIGYQEGIYRYSAQAPPVPSATHAVVEAWCRPVDTNRNPMMEVILYTSAGTSQPAYLVTQGATTEPIEAQRVNATNLRTYQDGSIFHMLIDLTNLSSNPPTYPGRLDNSPSGFYLGDLNCRILP